MQDERKVNVIKFKKKTIIRVGVHRVILCAVCGLIFILQLLSCITNNNRKKIHKNFLEKKKILLFSVIVNFSCIYFLFY